MQAFACNGRVNAVWRLFGGCLNDARMLFDGSLHAVWRLLGGYLNPIAWLRACCSMADLWLCERKWVAVGRLSQC
eukprot:11200791-Lingulodinium_polyedra.AAC.1